ncbi:MAG: NAD-dependent epimerase/dehydratase family protein [Syntrophobacterales bacterium]|nr:NAD-dependent epimerase/dehydratase family protein [Syntrophobacterales bacterium]
MKLKAFVTGATGFIGSHVVEVLIKEGWDVVALCRCRRLPPFLNFEGVKWVEGNILDFSLIRRLVENCDAVFHVAADYRLWCPDPKEIYSSNVEGTRNVMQAVLEVGVPKVVYTSSVGALGLNKDRSPADETTPVTLSDMVGHYKRSKYLAERLVEEFIEKGLPAVIVNPSTPIGPRDHKPTPTGRIIVDFLNGKMPAYVDTGLNFIHVVDVAIGHLLAYRRGNIGEKYILGAHNVTLQDFLNLLSELTGLPAPRVKLPLTPIEICAFAAEFFSRLTRRPPFIPLEGVKMSRYCMFFSAEKAVRELGLPQQPLETAVRDAVEWYIEHGYCRRPISIRQRRIPK